MCQKVEFPCLKGKPSAGSSGGTTAWHEFLHAPAVWANLRLDGYGPGLDGKVLEFRRCPFCGSTLTAEVTADLADRGLIDADGVIKRSRDALRPSPIVSSIPVDEVGCHVPH